jgi:PAS domain S-box-containing protein
MKSKIVMAALLLGWLIPYGYLFYDYYNHKYGTMAEFYDIYHHHDLHFHILVTLIPIVFTLIAYLANEREKYVSRLKESESLYLDYYRNAPDGYYSVNADGFIIEANETWFRMFGYERDEVIGRMKIAELLDGKGLALYKEKYPVFKEEGFIKDLEYDFKRKDGSVLPVIVNATAIYDGRGNYLRSRSIARDNGIKKGYEKILIRASDEWRATFDAMPHGVMLLDCDYNIAKSNDYIANALGIPIKKLIGRKCYEAVHGRDRPPESCLYKSAVENNKDASFEFFEPGLNAHFMMDITPIKDEDGITLACVHSFVDITGIKGKESDLVKSRNAFLNMLRDATADYRELKELHKSLIFAFSNAIDAKSPWTKGHSERVMQYSVKIAGEMKLGEKEIEILKIACLLHDIGKIGIYDGILNKAGKLTNEEFALVKAHPLKGVEILKPVSHLDMILPLVRYHHERLDGLGYPDGLREKDIPLLARIIHVADSYDSMTADRPYRASPGMEYAVSELRRCSGSQFDPEVVDAFIGTL